MILEYDFYKIMVLMHPNLTKEKFIKYCGAKEGYASRMFIDMYNSITSERIDLLDEYKKFYAFEYESFENFLYKKYNLDKETIGTLLKTMNKNKECRLYRKDRYSYGNYGIGQFMTSDTMIDRISKVLLKD